MSRRFNVLEIDVSRVVESLKTDSTFVYKLDNPLPKDATLIAVDYHNIRQTAFIMIQSKEYEESDNGHYPPYIEDFTITNMRQLVWDALSEAKRGTERADCLEAFRSLDKIIVILTALLGGNVVSEVSKVPAKA